MLAKIFDFGEYKNWKLRTSGVGDYQYPYKAPVMRWNVKRFTHKFETDAAAARATGLPTAEASFEFCFIFALWSIDWAISSVWKCLATLLEASLSLMANGVCLTLSTDKLSCWGVAHNSVICKKSNNKKTASYIVCVACERDRYTCIYIIIAVVLFHNELLVGRLR